MNIAKIYKALYAGIGGGVLAFVPLASGATTLAIISDIGIAVLVGIGTAITTYIAPANKS